MTALAEPHAGSVTYELPKRVQLEVEFDANTLDRLQAMWPVGAGDKLDRVAFRRVLLEFFNEVDLDTVQFRRLDK